MNSAKQQDTKSIAFVYTTINNLEGNFEYNFINNSIKKNKIYRNSFNLEVKELLNKNNKML